MYPFLPARARTREDSDMAQLFGTDGIRGVANRDLTPELALLIGRAAGIVLAPSGGEIVVGRDTRVSGPMLEGALAAGLASAGADVRLAGIITTPGVAFLTLDERAKGGAVISASHNPIDDNGIKFFSDEGLKTPAEAEDKIESVMASDPPDLPIGDGVGGIEELGHGHDRYVDHLLGTLNQSLTGLRVVLDCAYGAAYALGPRAFREAGAEVIAIHAEPDGRRINVDCGSTSMGELQRRVVEEGADLGIAFDGDADRALAVDERGEAVDGDRILALSALHLLERKELVNSVVVTTVMANLGFQRFLEHHGIEVVSAPVGDRFVAEAMADRGAVLGGEQSGHVIFGGHTTTGDGILTGLQVAQTVVSSGAVLSAIAHPFEPYPQVLVNVPVADRTGLGAAEGLWAEVTVAEEALGDEGRVLVRASGTEPVVRVMVEAADEAAARTTASRLAEAVLRHLS
jgi:phosphoglucosamine mutase